MLNNRLMYALVVSAISCAAGCVGAEDASDAATDPDGIEQQEQGSSAETCGFAHRSEVSVRTTSELRSALSSAAPGTLIRLADATYRGTFEAKRSGTEAKPIILCGSRRAVFEGGSVSSGTVLHLNADYWVLSGFTVKKGKKGIVLDEANHNLLTDLQVEQIGQEAVHFRTNSTFNTLQSSLIRETGKVDPGFGEAVYLGSAKSNWKGITGSSTKPDKSDNNKVLSNTLGPNVAAELIDIKEGTKGGEIRGNTFKGAGMSGENFADSWIDVKGNSYVIADNTGTDALADGFQVHVQLEGWGNNNVFRGNTAAVNAAGFGFSIDGDSTGNVVYCDNRATGARAGLANVTCKR